MSTRKIPIQKFLVPSEVELVYRSKVKAAQRPSASNAAEAYRILMAAWNLDTIELREEFKVLLLNNANKVLGIYHAFAGQSKGVTIDIRLIFAAAIKANATGIILAHNHVSGALTPSNTDKLLTDKMIFVGELHDIKIIDHLILNRQCFCSMAERGLLV